MTYSLARLIWAVLPSVLPGYCLLDRSEDNFTYLNYQGTDYVLPLGQGTWNSPRHVSRILQILLEEVIGIKTVLNTFGSGSDFLAHLAGCTDEAGIRTSSCEGRTKKQNPPVKCWFGVEVWATGLEAERLSSFSENAGPMGYISTLGLYTYSTTMQEARANNVMLSWWETYEKQPNGGPTLARPYFSSVVDLTAAIKNLNAAHNDTRLNDTFEDPGDLYPACRDIAAQSDAGWRRTMFAAGLVCDDDGWYYSPACSRNKTECIPVVLGEPEWNAAEWCQVVRNLNLPFAVTWINGINWFGEVEVVMALRESHSFLFYWYEPDSTFKDFKPDRPQTVNFNEGDMLIRQNILSSKYLWEGFREAFPRIYKFVREATFTNTALTEMMASNESAEELACNWIKENRIVWSEWIPEPETVVIEVREVKNSRIENILLFTGVGLIGFGVVFSLSFIFVSRAWPKLKRWQDRREDSPDLDHTYTGEWVKLWLGNHVHRRLGSPSTCSISRSLPHKGYRFGDGIGQSWVVNATPLQIVFSGSAFPENKVLPPESSCRIFVPKKMDYFRISITANADARKWLRCPDAEDICFDVFSWDWHNFPPEQQTATHIYESDVQRKHLPVDSAGSSLGELKLVRGPRGVLLISWSPPHVVRGIPLCEFMDFLQDVIDHEGTWDCTSHDQSGNVIHITKRKGDKTRNMYDACEHLIKKEVVPMDASFAELRTDFGPPDIFISHVWAETAHHTLLSIQKFRSDFREASSASALLTIRDTDTDISRSRSSSYFDQTRVWFCTACNNQSRIQEELGEHVHNSPFAKVIRLDGCRRAVLLSPFKALKRKWCNYEYCLAVEFGKERLTVTTEGVVEWGQVAPKTLNDLSEMLCDFKSEDATCNNQTDGQLIDDAVRRMGGYLQIDIKLRDIFTEAIAEAQAFTEKARARLSESRLARSGSYTTTPAANVLRERTGAFAGGSAIGPTIVSSLSGFEGRIENAMAEEVATPEGDSQMASATTTSDSDVKHV